MAPCPKETELFGVVTLDGSPDEYETYFAVTDDDFTKMVGMEYCIQDNLLQPTPEHFLGFKPRIYSPISGDSYQVFGDMSGSQEKVKCYNIPLVGELMFF